jgi:hypothetical protein
MPHTLAKERVSAFEYKIMFYHEYKELEKFIRKKRFKLF